MAKKKVVKIDTENVDLNLEKDGTNIKIDLDTKNVDINVIKNELNKEFHYDSKNIDIDIVKTDSGIEVKVETSGALWKIIAKRIVKFVLKRFKR